LVSAICVIVFVLQLAPILEESADKSNLAQYSAIMKEKMAIPSLWEKMSKVLFALPIVFALASCARDESGDLADAMTMTSDEVNTLNDILNGTSYQSSDSSTSSNTETTLLFAILGVVILIAILVAFKVFKKK